MNQPFAPWDKAALVTVQSGIDAAKLPGLVRYESTSFDAARAIFEGGVKPAYSHEEIYGETCPVFMHIDVPRDVALDYLANIYSLEEYTYSIRALEPVGNGVYRGTDAIVPDTLIYIRSEVYRDAGVVDHVCAWDQGDELWMRYNFRLVDAQVATGRSGTLLSMLNYRHPYYARTTAGLPAHVQRSQARTDRPWVGDLWPMFHPIHRAELENAKALLEARVKT